jgi:ketosteroid isomerase-like protein
MAAPTPQQFIDALHRLEAERDLDGIVQLFGDDAELSNPNLGEPMRGREGAAKFWESYRHSFDDIGSSFRHVAQDDGAALLEWESRGKLADGTPFAYDGVSVLEIGEAGITRFRTYFDPTSLKHRTDGAH